MKLRRLALLGWALPVFAQYAGPAILSRGEAPGSLSPPEIKFRPFVEIAGTYNTGLSGVATTDAQGSLPNVDSYGLTVGFGVSGVHSWRHTKLSLSYLGNLADYYQNTEYDYISQSLHLGIQHQIARHVSISLREDGGVSSRGFGLFGLSQTVAYDPTQAYVPTTDFFDNHTYYLSSQADAIYQRSARLSFGFGGDNFIYRYSSHSLTGSLGLGAHGDMQYRLSRHTTAGGGYRFNHFTYSRLNAATDAHSFSLSLSHSLSARTEFSVSAGAMRVEQKFIQNVAVDPVIAAILGIGTTTEISHAVVWGSVWSGRLSHVLRSGVLFANAGRSLTPGNGLFLTSYVTTVGGGYTYTGLRTWSLSALVHSNWAKSVGNIQGDYNDLAGGISASRRLMRSVHLVFGVEARQYRSPNFHNYNRLTTGAHVGLGFTPGEVPLRIW